MFRRIVRIACLVVGLLATAGLAYRALQDEDTLTRQRQTAADGLAAASQTVELLLDLRGSLHAYVAPGQGLPFWGSRTRETMEKLRQSLAELDTVVSRTGGTVAESLDAVDQLTAAERRARTYVTNNEMQLAGDVIFAEIRDLLAAATEQVESIRSGMLRENDRRAVALRQEQLMLAGAAIAVWIAISLLLLPTEQKPAVKDPAEWRNELRETLKKPVRVTPETLVAPPVVAEVPPPSVPLADVRKVSEICSDLSSLVDPGALQGALARVSSVLNANGLIVWIAANDSGSLAPVATCGFDPKLVARIGKIGRESSNLTAAAFRANAARVSAVTASAPGALAVPMCSPTGPAGVLSVELKAGQPVDDAKVALAEILAAQLATLAMPIPSTSPAEVAVDERVEDIPEPRRAAV
jgi:hypothetical protein